MLDALLLDMKALEAAVEQAKVKFTPTHLMLSRGDFDGLCNAAMLYGHHYLVHQLRKLGIDAIVWCETSKDGQMILTTAEGLPEGIETLSIKAKQR